MWLFWWLSERGHTEDIKNKRNVRVVWSVFHATKVFTVTVIHLSGYIDATTSQHCYIPLYISLVAHFICSSAAVKTCSVMFKGMSFATERPLRIFHKQNGNFPQSRVLSSSEFSVNLVAKYMLRKT